MKRGSKKIKERIKKTIEILAEKSFIVSLCFIFLSLLLGGALFYRYNYLDKSKPEPEAASLKLQKEAYEDILKEWDRMGANFEGANSKDYLDPFAGPAD